MRVRTTETRNVFTVGQCSAYSFAYIRALFGATVACFTPSIKKSAFLNGHGLKNIPCGGRKIRFGAIAMHLSSRGKGNLGREAPGLDKKTLS